MQPINGSADSQPTSSTSAAAIPGSPLRDHEVPPVVNDSSESTLPEGAQPTRRVAWASRTAIAALLVVGAIVIVTAGLVFFGPRSLPIVAVLTLVMVCFGLWPIIFAARLRASDEKKLNREGAIQH